MATRKEAEAAAREAGVSADEIKSAKNISEVEALTAAAEGNAPDANPNAGTNNLPEDGRNSAEGPANAGGEDMRAGGGSQTGPGTDQLRGIPPTAATIEPPAPTAGDLQSNKGGEITRMTAVAWWCPNCDNSNERSLNSCAKCGAQVSEDGKSVGKPTRQEG